MSDAPTRQAVTANDLLSGDVVYLTARLHWSRSLGDAALADSDAEADCLLAAAKAQPAHAVEPYLIAVRCPTDGRAQPVHYRERIRTLGPSHRTDLGPQATKPAIRRQATTPAVRRQDTDHVPL
ncbi:MAG: DUF2849 domain-containing protein [Alphaproteobacteria bacterium]|nr:DUF2849 domain-containing protein [Alphaproteobacteria bacterium]